MLKRNKIQTDLQDCISKICQHVHCADDSRETSGYVRL